jgi:hypothetical protein
MRVIYFIVAFCISCLVAAYLMEPREVGSETVGGPLDVPLEEKGVIGVTLEGKTTREKSDIKSAEIVKVGQVAEERVQFSDADYRIEVISTNPIDGGVEVLARAWMPDGTPIGFGVDGSVEIERFRIFNPPILVADPTGPVKRYSHNIDTGATTTYAYREDPKAALMQTLAHTIKVKTQKSTNASIELGKIGNTTSTFYPDADAESTSVDGYLISSVFGTWAGARDATTAGGGIADNDTILLVRSYKSGANYGIIRSFTLFDTSALGDSDTIDSATVSLQPTGSGDGQDENASVDMVVVQTSPAADTSLTANDYDNLTFTSGGSLAWNNFIGGDDVGVYQDITMNATGLTWITKTGVTKLGFISSLDLNSTDPTARSNANELCSADQSGTTCDPKLVVESTAGGATATTTPLLQVTGDTQFGGDMQLGL